MRVATKDRPEGTPRMNHLRSVVLEEVGKNQKLLRKSLLKGEKVVHSKKNAAKDGRVLSFFMRIA